MDGRTASEIERSRILGEVRNDGVVDLQQRAEPVGTAWHLGVPEDVAMNCIASETHPALWGGTLLLTKQST
jgi:hypothetical protein